MNGNIGRSSSFSCSCSRSVSRTANAQRPIRIAITSFWGAHGSPVPVKAFCLHELLSRKVRLHHTHLIKRRCKSSSPQNAATSTRVACAPQSCSRLALLATPKRCEGGSRRLPTHRQCDAPRDTSTERRGYKEKPDGFFAIRLLSIPAIYQQRLNCALSVVSLSFGFFRFQSLNGMS